MPEPSTQHVTIQQIQGTGLTSPYARQPVTTRGVVTGSTRKGFFLQDPGGRRGKNASCAVFVFAPGIATPVGSVVEVEGEAVDYVAADGDHPTTQVVRRDHRVLEDTGPLIEPIWLTANALPTDDAQLALFLNGLEGMLVGIEAGATFIAPSNPFGDYVVLPKGMDGVVRTRHGGVRLDLEHPHRWFPGFRVLDWNRAPQVHVGAELLSPVVGPLNYRSASYQVVARLPVEVRNVEVEVETGRLPSDAGHLTVLTLNGFNLDPKVEDPAKVHDANRDVDDDVGNGRFRMLAEAVVKQALSPDVVALQEIQDSDGAEISEVVDATLTYGHLIRAVREAGGPRYAFADVPPVNNADGGQPGGNIRNGFLYDPERVELLAGTLGRIGEDDPAFEDSRKVLVGRFKKKGRRKAIAVLNVHLASKRQQHGIFAAVKPGHDPRLETRVRQAQKVREHLLELREAGVRYYVTGDFNDFETSDTLQALEGSESVNLVEAVPEEDRYDYNHRGQSQVLMHGVVSREDAASGRVAYEILHGNELLGVQPGKLGDKPTDHAYVIASFEM